MPRPITVVFDMDGVLAGGTRAEVYSNEAGWAYDKCTPIPEGLEALMCLKASGVRIIIYTARWESDREVTEAWLRRHEVEYDELKMDKPSAELYIDDKGFHFNPSENQALKIGEAIMKNRSELYTEGT